MNQNHNKLSLKLKIWALSLVLRHFGEITEANARLSRATVIQTLPWSPHTGGGGCLDWAVMGRWRVTAAAAWMNYVGEEDIFKQDRSG